MISDMSLIHLQAHDSYKPGCSMMRMREVCSLQLQVSTCWRFMEDIQVGCYDIIPCFPGLTCEHPKPPVFDWSMPSNRIGRWLTKRQKVGLRWMRLEFPYNQTCMMGVLYSLMESALLELRTIENLGKPITPGRWISNGAQKRINL